MPLVPVGPAVGGPFTSIDCPSDNDPAAALDIRRPVAALLRNDELAAVDISGKVAKAGDTSTGLQVFAAGATVSSGQILTLDGVSVQGVVGFSSLGEVLLYGRKAWYRGRGTLTDADHTVDVSSGDRFNVPAANAAPRTITLDGTIVVPDIGETLTFFWNPGTGGGGGTQYTFVRDDATVIATFVGAQVADTGAVFAEFEYTTGSVWRLGKHSGTPNEFTTGPDTWTSYGVIPGAGA